jgi:hypothetical protein
MAHLEKVRRLHGYDLAGGFGAVELPYARDGAHPPAFTRRKCQIYARH